MMSQVCLHLTDQFDPHFDIHVMTMQCSKFKRSQEHTVWHKIGLGILVSK